MADYIYSLILLIIALLCIELRKSYHAVPKSELRYRALNGDALADKIYHAVSYEDSLEVLLWSLIILCSAGSLILFNRVAPLWLSFIAIVLFIWTAFAWLPRRRVGIVSQKVAQYFTPAVVWLLNYLHPVFRKLNKIGSKGRVAHTGIYDKNDLIKFIQTQKKQADSRLSERDLDLVKKGLKLSGKTVSDHSVAWSKIKRVKAHDTVGPILLDELHKSNQLYIPVTKDDDTKTIVGIINTSGLDISKVGEVRDIMDPNVHYVNEDDTLEDVLDVITTTGSPVFIVLDKKQRLFGLITIRDVMSQLFTPKPKPEEVIVPEQEKEEKNDTTETETTEIA